jgi:DNA-binding MarR family transcriptional regulator
MKIIDRKKPCTANDIASYLGRDKAQVTRLLNTLIDRGLINKVPNPDDKRSQYLNISDSGMLLVKEIAKIDDNVMAMMRKNLTQDELVEFGRIADVMSKNLESD